MNTHQSPSKCRGCPMSRRGFLAAGGAACVGAAGLLMPGVSARAAEASRKLRIRVVYALHAEVQAQPDWPNVGFDFRPVMDRIDAALAEACPDFTFLRALASGEEPARKILEEDANADIDGYIVCQMNCWNVVAQTFLTSNKPVLYADFPYAGSGGFLVYTASFLRAGAPHFGFVASSRLEDLVEAAKCFGTVPAEEFGATVARVRRERTPQPGDLACTPDPLETLPIDECIERMKASKILAVRDAQAAPAEVYMGIPLEYIAFAELNEAWEKADRDEARAIADRWEKTAVRIDDVSRETLETSAAMYLAQKELLARHGANAITVNCLGGFYGGHIHAYPCLGFHELLNEGLIGACECDVPSTACMVALTTLTRGRPGYISDPVIDTSKRRIIYAHCVASNRALGPDGPANAFEILTHSEDRQGASVRSILPEGYMTTTVEVRPERQEFLFHQGKALGNDPNDRACRTKLEAEPVGDIEKLFTQWDHWGWHRVTYYGDLKEPVFALADALGYKVVEEA